jgi:anti-sigma B factor antagonist
MRPEAAYVWHMSARVAAVTYRGSNVATDTGLTCTARREGTTTCVRVAGELDLSTRDALIRCVHQAIDQGADEVALDLSSVRFCDTSGLSALLAVHRIAQDEQCDLRIASMTTNMQNMLIMTNLSERLVGRRPDDG